MTDVLAALWVVLGLEDNASAQLETANAKMEKSTSKSVGKMSGSLTTWRDNVNKSNAEMAKWATAIGSTVAPAAAAVAIAVAEVNKFGNIADTINDLSYATGLSTRKIQELQYAAVLSNTEFSAVTGGIKLFTIAIAEAKDESSEAARAFETLGVATIGRSYDQIWEDTARAIANVKDETTRAALANTLYGRGWQEMVPYIHDYVQDAEKIQGIDYLTDEQLADLEKSKAELDALGYKFTILEGQVVSFFAKNEGIIGKWLKEKKSDLVGEGLLSLVVQEGAQSGAGGRGGVVATPPPVPTTAADVASAIVEGMTATDAKAAYLREYTIPGLQKAYDALKVSGTSSAEDIDAAYIQLQEAKEQLIRLTEEQTESEKDLAKAVGDVEAEYQRLDDINKDFARELSILNPRDVAGARNLIIQHQFDVEDQEEKIAKIQTEISTNSAPIEDLLAKYEGSEINLVVTADTTQAEARLVAIIKAQGKIPAAGAPIQDIRAKYEIPEINPEVPPGIPPTQGIIPTTNPIEDLYSKYDGSEITLKVMADTSPAEEQIKNIVINPLDLTPDSNIPGPTRSGTVEAGVSPGSPASLEDLLAKYDGSEINLKVTVDTAKAEAQLHSTIYNPLDLALGDFKIPTDMSAENLQQWPDPRLPGPFISHLPSEIAAQEAAPPGNMNLPNITYGDLIVNIDSKQVMKVGGIMATRPGSERMNLTQRGI